MIDTIFFWNVRGLGRSRKRLKNLASKFNASLVAISEPFTEAARMPILGNFLNFPYCCSNEVEGRKLWIFWRVPIAFEILCCSAQMITG